MTRLRLLPVFLALLVAGCAGTPVGQSPSAEDLYRQAEQAVAKKDPEAAQKLLDRVRDDFPFSRFAVDAELLSADLAFGSEKYEEASAAYRVFEEQHPSHPRALYALYRRALAQLELSRPADRDQTATRNAAAAFQKLLNASPAGEFSADAKTRLAVVRSRLAEHELHVARYYLAKGQPEAAAARLKTVVEEYPETPEKNEASDLLRSLEGGAAAGGR